MKKESEVKKGILDTKHSLTNFSSRVFTGFEPLSPSPTISQRLIENLSKFGGFLIVNSESEITNFLDDLATNQITVL